ncbi:LysR substrate-binding domain-containing protein [Ideonella sp.]|uniref:LysR substrate-binding domain-containing protein n=1 Tax=Ideonella sp. TaxID=1929293 RepID=UPI003BB4B8DE
MTDAIQAAEISFFATLAAQSSLSAAARALGVSTAAVSKRLLQIEARLGVVLIHRSTRRMSLTPEGEVFYEKARRILDDIADLNQQMALSQRTPQGLLRINASPGFGRLQVAPAVARFATRHPQVELQLQLSVHPPPVSDDSFDVGVRFGEPPDARALTRHLASNRRLLCASPAYIARHGRPAQPQDLAHHQCLIIRQGDEAHGLWRLSTGTGARQRTDTVKVRGHLSTNDGEIAVNWALDGLGVLMRSEFDVRRYLDSGRLVQLLPQFETPGADIYAVYPQRHQTTLRVQLWIDFLAEWLKADGRAAAPAGRAPP